MFKAGEIVKISKTYCDAYSLPTCHGILIEELVSELYSVRIFVRDANVLIHYYLGVGEEFLSHV